MNNAKLLRFERGLTSEAVAAGAGISKTTLRAIEAGRDVSAPQVKAVADFYEVTAAVLLGLEPVERAA